VERSLFAIAVKHFVWLKEVVDGKKVAKRFKLIVDFLFNRAEAILFAE